MFLILRVCSNLYLAFNYYVLGPDLILLRLPRPSNHKLTYFILRFCGEKVLSPACSELHANVQPQSVAVKV